MVEEFSLDDGPVEAPPGVMDGKTICEPLTEVPDPARLVFEKWSCCFAQEVRQLVLDGAPPGNIFGADLSSDLMDMGHKLFLDEDKLGVRFIQSDILDKQSTLRVEFKGLYDVIHASNFFHVWPWAKTIQVAKDALDLLSDKPGSVILGTQVGTRRAKNVNFPHINRSAFFHTTETWKRLWGVAANETGSRLDVQVTEDYFPDQDIHGWPEELEFIRLRFIIRRT
ncbi:hypothetical protein N7478_006285 [Penicillium angulare]|uniref:uncharacterized protein n=1 Tax=Penicillium angulare TaxID=116970 RepID=UPI002540B588|nr:uncharacterized protein N7478_006285 [Penicillium angulare]KAJ5280913.1 hypothetical protein N7478_006285 [Penicillium angulare]